MQALWFNGQHEIEVKELMIPKLQQDELLVHVDACGVCGTDFHIYEGQAPSSIPVVLGHEYTGIILEMGSKFHNLKIGDKIAINPNIHCGYCEFCRKGKINLCSNLKALGVTLNGGMSQLSVVPVTQAYLLPNDFPYSKSVFAEPLSCCIHGINLAEILPGEKVLIIGAGTIGLLMLQLVQLRGASDVIVLDPIRFKRDMASSLNADHVFNPLIEDTLEKIIHLTYGGADTVIECVGNQVAGESALNLVRKGGKILIFGLSNNSDLIKVYMQTFFHKELTLKSSILNPYTFQSAVDLLVNNKINVEIFNPHPVLLNQDSVEKLFNRSDNKNIIKFMVTPNN
ncbi:MAG: zinc-dependent alcohol dehydrogenase family protein [Ignavibacteriaceae bacterium]|nr:zinc-dependent alcohol dehydrogenase family protein [Ignavibacteriaceae bacterium]